MKKSTRKPKKIVRKIALYRVRICLDCPVFNCYHRSTLSTTCLAPKKRAEAYEKKKKNQIQHENQISC